MGVCFPSFGIYAGVLPFCNEILCAIQQICAGIVSHARCRRSSKRPERRTKESTLCRGCAGASVWSVPIAATGSIAVDSGLVIYSSDFPCAPHRCSFIRSIWRSLGRWCAIPTTISSRLPGVRAGRLRADLPNERQIDLMNADIAGRHHRFVRLCSCDILKLFQKVTKRTKSEQPLNSPRPTLATRTRKGQL